MATAERQRQPASYPHYDRALATLDAAKDAWARTSAIERMAILQDVKDALMPIARGWAETAARKKQIPEGSPLAGEEWMSGPYAVMASCNGLLHTLTQMPGKEFIRGLSTRELITGQTAVRVLPHSIWDRLLLSGVKAEVWMRKGVERADLAKHAAVAYATPENQRKGKVSLVLGAGNIAAIAPLDCFQKLFLENQVVILKMNPVNDYLTDYLQIALKPLIERDALRIVKGDGAAGAYLAEHPTVEELHITGAGATHDAIVWGTGVEGEANKKARTRKNQRRLTSELGAVCPTIVVPGPWSAADIRFQAENIATQKMHNSGYNCVACQALILPRGWAGADRLMDAVKTVIAGSTRLPYYPGTEERLDAFTRRAGKVARIDRGQAPACVINDMGDDAWFRNNEVFAPAMSTYEVSAPDAETCLRNAIAFANNELHGTLGASILIHPRTIRQIGGKTFERIIADLRYGTIAINGWPGLGFLLAQCPWGAYPGHVPEDVQSGIGTVHNTYMLEETERTVVWAPWSPFPRGLLSGQPSLLPRPPWFITNGKQHIVGMLLTRFQHKPGWLKLPRILLNALMG